MRDELQDVIEQTKDDTHYIGSKPNKLHADVMSLINRMIEHHRESNAAHKQDVLDQAFEMYAFKLASLEKKDITSLKQKVGDLKGMEKRLRRDLDEAGHIRTAIF